MQRLSRSAAVAAGLAVLLTGCSAATGAAPAADPPAGVTSAGPPTPSAAGAFPVTVPNCDTDVTIATDPQRVMTVGTNAVWLLDAAGAGDRIIARSGEFGAELGTPELDAGYADVPIVDPSDPSTEAIVGTGADTVVGYGLFNASSAALPGITSLVNLAECGHDGATGTPPRITVGTVLDDITRLGEAFGTPGPAAATVSELQAELGELAGQVPADGATTVVLYYFGGELGTHGGRNVTDDIINRAGLRNIFADEPQMFLTPNVETILEADPDYVIALYGVNGETQDELVGQLRQQPGLADLPALQHPDRIIPMPYNSLAASPGAVDGVRRLIAARSGSGS